MYLTRTWINEIYASTYLHAIVIFTKRTYIMSDYACTPMNLAYGVCLRV